MPDPAQARPLLPFPSEPGSGHGTIKELKTDFAEARHTVSIKYPIHRLVNSDANEEFRMLPPLNASQRYYGEDLVEERQVIENASQYNRHESSFFFFGKVDHENMAFADANGVPPLPAMPEGSDVYDRLIRDMDSYSRTVGKTTLRVALYVPAPDEDQNEEQDETIRIERTSKAYTATGCYSANVQQYDFPLWELEQATEEPAFLHIILHLLKQQSLRALRHVSYWLKAQGLFDENDWGFRGRRRVNFVTALDPLLEPVDVGDLVDDAGKQCSICLEAHSDQPGAPHRPVRLARCGHVFGYECIKTWCADKESEYGLLITPQCPFRCKIFSDIAVRRRMRDGTCHSLPQFSAYENSEIACADLDAEPDVALVQDKHIRIRAEVMKHALKTLVDDALLEEPDSTPFHLQAIRFGETQLAIATMQNFFTRNDGCRLTYRKLYSYLVRSIARQLLAKARKGSGHRYNTSEQNQSMTTTEWAMYTRNGASVRPGFYECVNRLIRRTIMFQKLRPCSCKKTRFHRHGARSFWNPKSFPAAKASAEKLHRDRGSSTRRRLRPRQVSLEQEGNPLVRAALQERSASI